MPKKPRVRTLLDSEDINVSETLLKSAWHCFCQIFWSLWKKMSSKNSILVVSEILKLFVNMLTPDEEYCLSGKASVWRNQFKYNNLQLKKCFLRPFLHFQNLHKILNILEKNICLRVIRFWIYRLQKEGLLKCLKNPMSEHLWSVNMLKEQKYCLNLHSSIFFIFSDCSERKWVRTILS